MWGAVGVVYSRINRSGTNFYACLTVGNIFGVLAAAATLVDWDALLAGPPRVWALVGVIGGMALCNALAFSLMQWTMRRGHHGAIFSISQSAMIVPFTAAAIVFGETLCPERLIGITLIICGVIGFGLAKPGRIEQPAQDQAWLIGAIVSLLLVGLSQTLSTIPSHWTGWSDTAHLRVPLLLLGYMLSYGTPMVIKKSRIGRSEIIYGAIFAALALGSQALIFLAMDRLAPLHALGLTYPIGVGTSVLAFAAYSHFILREPYGWMQYLAIGLNIFGITFLAISKL